MGPMKEASASRDDLLKAADLKFLNTARVELRNSEA